MSAIKGRGRLSRAVTIIVLAVSCWAWRPDAVMAMDYYDYRGAHGGKVDYAQALPLRRAAANTPTLTPSSLGNTDTATEAQTNRDTIRGQRLQSGEQKRDPARSLSLSNEAMGVPTLYSTESTSTTVNAEVAGNSATAKMTKIERRHPAPKKKWFLGVGYLNQWWWGDVVRGRGMVVYCEHGGGRSTRVVSLSYLSFTHTEENTYIDDWGGASHTSIYAERLQEYGLTIMPRINTITRLVKAYIGIGACFGYCRERTEESFDGRIYKYDFKSGELCLVGEFGLKIYLAKRTAGCLSCSVNVPSPWEALGGMPRIRSQLVGSVNVVP